MSDRFDWSVIVSRHGVTFTSRYAVMHKKTCVLDSSAVGPYIARYQRLLERNEKYLRIKTCLKRNSLIF